MKAGLKSRAELELDRFALDPYCRLYLPFWKLDGDSFMSRDAHGHLCTNHGSIWTPYGRSFDGVDDYVEVANSASISDYSSGVTVCLWFKADRTDVNQGQFGQNGPGYLNFWMAGGSPATRLRWETNAGQSFSSNTQIYANKWYFACGVYDTSLTENQAKLYINGNLDNEKTLTFTTEKTDDITIGGYSPTSYLFKGLIGEVRIYNRALIPQEILDHYIIGKEMFG